MTAPVMGSWVFNSWNILLKFCLLFEARRNRALLVGQSHEKRISLIRYSYFLLNLTMSQACVLPVRINVCNVTGDNQSTTNQLSRSTSSPTLHNDISYKALSLYNFMHGGIAPWGGETSKICRGCDTASRCRNDVILTPQNFRHLVSSERRPPIQVAERSVLNGENSGQ
jgi:hypothetical protein